VITVLYHTIINWLIDERKMINKQLNLENQIKLLNTLDVVLKN